MIRIPHHTDAGPAIQDLLDLHRVPRSELQRAIGIRSTSTICGWATRRKTPSRPKLIQALGYLRYRLVLVPRGAPGPVLPAVGASLHQLRIQHGLTQKELAHTVGIDFAAISRAERGITGPTVEHLIAIAGALGHDVAITPEEDA